MFINASKLNIHDYTKKDKQCKQPIRNKFAPVPGKHILVVGPSGCGKTNLILNVIYDLQYWDNIYICAKDIHEEKYAGLLEDLEAAGCDSNCFAFCNDVEDFVTLDELDGKRLNLVIFDDFCVDSKALDLIKEYFIRGRKKNTTVVFLSQAYYAVPKVIRLNCSYIALFAMHDDHEISNIYQNNSQNLSVKDFKAAYHEATADKYSFMFIEKTVPPNSEYRLRKNFDCLKK